MCFSWWSDEDANPVVDTLALALHVTWLHVVGRRGLEPRTPMHIKLKVKEALVASATDWALTPPDVRTAFLSLVQMVRELSTRVQDLEVQLKLTSRNSSKPPSSDPPRRHPHRHVLSAANPKAHKLVMRTSNAHCCRPTKSTNWSCAIRGSVRGVKPH
jgi:hypothetical protein